jgi:putative transposase
MSLTFNRHPAGIALHVVRSGRRHGQCFFGERDRLAFLEGLRESATRFECAVHAYVLMGNHVHLLLTASDDGGTTQLMARVCERHEQSITDANDCSGGLWEDAFEASPIRVSRHFLACMRYIELNPVRARLVSRPDAFRWSSHGANALGRENPLVTPHPFYYALGRSDAERQTAYRRLFGVGVIPFAQTPGRPRTGPRGPSRPT